MSIDCQIERNWGHKRQNSVWIYYWDLRSSHNLFFISFKNFCFPKRSISVFCCYEILILRTRKFGVRTIDVAISWFYRIGKWNTIDAQVLPLSANTNLWLSPLELQCCHVSVMSRKEGVALLFCILRSIEMWWKFSRIDR